jgi:septum formation protein
MKVVLASASPRRHELLKAVIPEFEIDPADIDEDGLTVSDPYETAMGLAKAKAQHVALRHPGKIVIGSDTVVALPVGGKWVQYSKPTSFENAAEILTQLSGRTHSVITGVSVVAGEEVRTDFSETRVTFHRVTSEQIEEYVRTGEPMDKAGAYGAQGMGAFLVDTLEGSFDTVVGLPVGLVQNLMNQFTH